MKAYLFPGQGSQHVGMGKKLYYHSAKARHMFEMADKILNMDLTQIMLEGPEEVLKETAIAQPAVFIHSVVTASISPDFHPTAVAGHSLGEISALVASKVISFDEGLYLVATRSQAMQKACNLFPGGMVAVIGLPDQKIEEVCAQIKHATVVPANYNCLGQLVISGCKKGIALAVEALEKAGAQKIIPLKVEGGFHSPLMKSAQESLAAVLSSIHFSKGICPIYQNVTGLPTTEPNLIKENLLHQLISPIYWVKTILHMIQNNITSFIECGPGMVLQGLVRKIAPNAAIATATVA